MERLAQGEPARPGSAIDDRALALWLDEHPHVRGLDLRRHRLSAEGLARLATCPELEDLSLAESAFGDGEAAVLARLPSLRRLVLRQTRITSEGAMVLASLPSLEELDLSWTSIDDRLGPTLRGLEQLRLLRLEWTSAGDALVRALRGHPRLESLDLDQTRVTDYGITFLLELASLRQLVLPQLISARALASIARLPALERLDFAGASIDKGKWKALARLRGLVSLTLAEQPIGDGDLKWLVELERLRELYLWDTRAGDPTVGRVARLNRLEVLGLGGTRVTDVGLHALSAAQSLRALDLSRTYVTGGGLSALAEPASLAELNLSETALVSIAGLSALHSLQHLQLSHTPLDDERWSGARALGGLRSLDLTATRVVAPQLADLVDLRALIVRRSGFDGNGVRALRGCPELRQLDVAYTAVGSALPEALPRLSHLEELDLSGADLGDLAWLAQLPSLQRLVARDCAGPTTTAPLAEHRVLRWLDLSRADGGATSTGRAPSGAGAEIAHVPPLLEELDLGQRAVSAAAIAAIAGCKGLRALRLDNVGVDGAMLSTVGALERLEELSLRGNPIEDEHLAALRNLSRLEQVDLSETEVTARGVSELKRGAPHLVLIREANGEGEVE